MDPFMPSKMEEAWKQLGMGGLVVQSLFEDALVQVPEGQMLGKPAILFNRMEDSKVKELDEIFKERIEAAESKDKDKAEKVKNVDKISFSEFQSIDLRVGEIQEAEPIKGSDKLLRLIVDIGTEKRQVVAGIAQAYKPEELVGTQVVVVTNLEPAKLFGVESQAMLLAADLGGKAMLLRPENKVDPGTRVR
jgi:methionyl-tRNA synthetase